jgi:uncharacterized protein
MSQHYIVDRRGETDRSSPNRERLLRRLNSNIKKAIPDILGGHSIETIGKDGQGIRIPIKGLDEPVFHNDQNLGKHHIIYSGNDRFNEGDTIPKPLDPQGETGSGTGDDAGTSGEKDDFIIHLSRQEFIGFFFSDLELPFMEEKKQTVSVDSYQMRHSGYRREGIPARLDVIKSLGNALGRRIALQKQYDKKIERAMEKMGEHDVTEEEARDFLQFIEEMKRRRLCVPYLDYVDLRYDFFTKEPVPINSAAMFCLMDVSGSMTKEEKSIAKRFFFFLYLFLESQYKEVDIIWIKHHVDAVRCTEDAFFNDRDGGGTVVSSALELAHNIKVNGDDLSPGGYPTNLWNIYFAQASDGDNDPSDDARCGECLRRILPYTNYFAYTQIRTPHEGNLWKAYEGVSLEYPRLQLRHINEKKEIWKVFHGLFKKQQKVA